MDTLSFIPIKHLKKRKMADLYDWPMNGEKLCVNLELLLSRVQDVSPQRHFAPKPFPNAPLDLSVPLDPSAPCLSAPNLCVYG